MFKESNSLVQIINSVTNEYGRETRTTKKNSVCLAAIHHIMGLLYSSLAPKLGSVKGHEGPHMARLDFMQKRMKVLSENGV